jgi:trehalose/maltose transport system substrate-binding protein
VVLLGSCSQDSRQNSTQPSGKASISISCSGVGQEFELCRQGVEAWSKKSGHAYSLVSTPNSTTERLALYQQLLAAGAPDVDVFQIDIIWPGLLANHLIDLKPYTGGVEKEHFPALIETDTVDGRLVALPWYTDAGLLFYRKDLLEKYGEPVPETWDELTAAARKIQEAERGARDAGMWGYVFQGRAYEGLTCNALEWISSYGGGRIVEADGRISVDNPEAVAALERAASWIGTITPVGVLNYTEEEARGVFQSGHAVFMRNWPYAWSLAQSADSPIRGKVGVAQLPKGGPDGLHASTLGGWNLAVSKYSRAPAEAADLVLFLTSAEEQKRRAVEAAYNPTIESLYKDQEVLNANPFFGALYTTFVNAVPRPSTPTRSRYNQVSYELWNAVHLVLSGRSSARDSLADLQKRLKRLSLGGRW